MTALSTPISRIAPATLRSAWRVFWYGGRMSYGMLLISEKQGVGKTTLGASILGPLIGTWNCSFPGENDILAQFNEWVAHKRLAVVSDSRPVSALSPPWPYPHAAWRVADRPIPN